MKENQGQSKRKIGGKSGKIGVRVKYPVDAARENRGQSKIPRRRRKNARSQLTTAKPTTGNHHDDQNHDPLI